MGFFKKKKEISTDVLEKRLENERALLAFHATRETGDFLKVDENAGLWYTAAGAEKKSRTVRRISDIVDYELIDDGTTTVKGGIGTAVAGGVLFGAVGAFVGSAAGKKKQTAYCTDLKIKITIKNADQNVVYIPFVTGRMKREGTLFKMLYNMAQECMSVLQIVTASNDHPAPQESAADEIRKFKDLLDSGAITQEEFDKKKAQLLGI